MIERRKLLKIGASGIAASVAMPFVGRTGWAATPTHTLKLTFADTQAHPLYDVLKRFSEDVSKRTSGAIEIQVFSIGQLGSGTNILTGLQTGIIDFCAHTSGFIDTIFPKFQVVDLPFLFSDSASAERLLDGPTGGKLHRKAGNDYHGHDGSGPQEEPVITRSLSRRCSGQSCHLPSPSPSGGQQM